MGKKQLDYLAIQEYYDEGNSMRETAEKFGTNVQTLQHAQKSGLFVTRDRSEGNKLERKKRKEKE